MVPRNLGILFLVPGDVAQTLILDHINKFRSRELLLSAGATPINFCSRDFFGIVPRNFSRSSQEQFPGIVPDELWPQCGV